MREPADEESPLLQKDHYVKRFGKGPTLIKMGSMRAGPSLGHKEGKAQHVKYKYIPKLYKKDSANIVPPQKKQPNKYERRDSV